MYSTFDLCLFVINDNSLDRVRKFFDSFYPDFHKLISGLFTDDENYSNSSSNNNYKSDEEGFEEASREFTQQKDLEKDPVTEQDIRFVLDVIKKEAPCDETAIKQLWYGMCLLKHHCRTM